MKFYKLRHKVTRLFSTGGRYPKFKAKGKTWSALGHVKSHLTMIRSNLQYGAWGTYRESIECYLHDVEIVEYAFEGCGERVVEVSD